MFTKWYIFQCDCSRDLSNFAPFISHFANTPIVGCHYGNLLITHLTYKTTLKILLPLSFLVTLFAVSCSTYRPTELVDIPVKLKSANKQLQSNFDSCLRLTQQLIRTQVSDKEFSEYFSLNKRATGFEYDNVVLSMSDTLFELPKGYQIFYDFIYKGDTLSSFRADFDANLNAIERYTIS